MYFSRRQVGSEAPERIPKFSNENNPQEGSFSFENVPSHGLLYLSYSYRFCYLR